MKNFLKKSWPFLALATLAFIIHFAFLSYPAQVVFDEVHFGKFVGAYFTGQYYFDIHPPLGKLMIAGVAKLAGINPVFSFNHIGEQISGNILFVLRFLPAFFGALFVLAFSWLSYLLTRSKTISLTAGFLIFLDNAFLVQSKFILVDIFMLSFEVTALCFFLLWQKQKSYSAKWFSYLLLTAVFFGLAISVKWTGLATIGIIGLALLGKIFFKRFAKYLSPDENKSKLSYFWESTLSVILILLIGLAVYCVPFYIHFKLLPHSGPGDAFMSRQFQQELKYGPESSITPLAFSDKFLELNKEMYVANSTLKADHPFGSKWYQWPLGHKPVYYWNSESSPNIGRIYINSNPILWWLSLAFLLFALFQAISKPKRFPIYLYIALFGYFCNLLPFIFVSRVAFLYHYLASIMFGIFILSVYLSELWPKEKKYFFLIVGVIAIGFLAFIPLSYGWQLPQAASQLEVELINIFG